MHTQQLTPAIQEEVLKLVRGGTPLEIAAGASGILERTLEEWRRRAQEEPTGPYAQFFSAAKEANVAYQVKLVTVIVQAARKGGKEAKQARKWLEDRWSKEDVAQVLAVDEAALPAAAQAFYTKLKPAPTLAERARQRLEELELSLAKKH